MSKMGKTEAHETPRPGFEVEIKSGGRAYDGGQAPRAAAPIVLSPARAAAKARAQRRNMAILAGVAFVSLVVATWAWLSNPSTGIPDGAVARVNGEYIYQRDIQRELDLTRVSKDLSKSTTMEVPSEAAVLEELISRKEKVQNAHKAGIVVSPADTDSAFKDILDHIGVTQAKLEAALGKYSLTVDDMRAVAADTFAINEYIDTTVVAGAATDTDRQNRINDWETNLAQTSKVDRLKPPGAGPAPRVGAEAPDFTLNNLEGKQFKLSTLKGRPVMINFWATWCPPCRAEIPTIAQMYKETHSVDGSANSPYEIVGVATQSDNSTIKAFTQEFSMAFPVLPDAESRVTSLYHVLPIPTTFFIDKDGIVRYIQIGTIDRPLMEKWLLK